MTDNQDPKLWFHEFGWVGPMADADEFMALMIDRREDRRYVYGGSISEATTHRGFPAYVDDLAESLRRVEGAASWLQQCLRDVNRGVPVRGLDEAEEGYRHAMAEAHALLTEVGP
jgi:hypothetical protein